jgi:hypothetical protein
VEDAPLLGPQLRLLGQLPLRAFELALPRAVEGAGGNLQQPVLLDRLARLGDEVGELAFILVNLNL